MLKLLRRKSFRKSKEFKPSSRTTLNSSSGSVSATCQPAGGGHYYLTRPSRNRTKACSVSSSEGAAGSGAATSCPNGATSQNSLEDRKSISSHRYSSVNLGTVLCSFPFLPEKNSKTSENSPVFERAIIFQVKFC